MTKVSMPIIGWVSEILGWMINVIYSGLELIGITNIGLSIILFTLVVYLLMTPLQIKQQKFSKLNAVMQPEIQKIQKKYNGKKDQDSMMKQNEEISAVYQKYGVSQPIQNLPRQQRLIFCTNCPRHRWKNSHKSAISADFPICSIK